MDTKLLKQKILDLAIRGKLVPQDPNDEPASVLLERIRAEKERLVAEGKIKRSKSTTDNRHYENVPFEIPKNWNWCKVEDFSYGLQYGTSEKSQSKGLICVLRMGNITRCGTIDYSDLVYSSNEDDIAKFTLQYNDLLFNRTNSSEWVGKTAIYKAEKPAIYAGYLIRIRTFVVCPDFINYVMNSPYHRDWCNQVKTDAVNQSNINAQKLSKLQIPIPPFDEQKRIVEEVQKWFALIDDVEQNKIDLLETIKQVKTKILDLAIHGKLVVQDRSDEPAIELLKRIAPNAVACDNSHYKNIPFEIPDSWVWVKLGDISDYGKCYNVDVEQIGQDDWVLELEDIEKDTARIIQYKTKSDRTIKGTRHKFTKDCVLYSKLRTYLNKVLVPEKDGFCTTEIIPINFVANIKPQYMCFVLRSQYFVDYTNQKGYGVKMPRLSTTDAKNGLIPLPPIDEQNRIVNRVEEIFASLFEIGAML